MKKDQKPQPQEIAEPDEFHGQGGEYIVENGKRRLVQRTQPPAPVPPVNDTKE